MLPMRSEFNILIREESRLKAMISGLTVKSSVGLQPKSKAASFI